MKKKYIFITLIILSVFFVSKVNQKNFYKRVNNLSNKSSFYNLVNIGNSIKFLSNETTYILSGEACKQKKYSTTFEKTLTSNEQYLCEVNENKGGIGEGKTKEVTIKFEDSKAGRFCYVDVYEKKDGSLYYIDPIYSNYYDSYKYQYKSGYDYKVKIECDSLYHNYIFVDNLKEDELESNDSIVRSVKLEKNISLDQDLNFIEIKDKILDDNAILNYTLNFNNISPSTTSYRETNFNRKLDIYSNSTYCYGDSYEFNSERGLYTIKNISCSRGAQIGKYTFLSSYSSSNNYSYLYKIENADNVSKNYYNVISYGIEPASDDTGLYKQTTSKGDTYFFRGTVQNNYVKFANYMWKIIRINEDGSVRLILDGDIGSTNWNTNTRYKFYNGYTNGSVNFFPLVGEESTSWVSNLKNNDGYCYSNKIIYDKNQNKYKLDGTITCSSFSNGPGEGIHYSLYSTNRYMSSSKLYKFTKSSYSDDYSLATYDASKYQTQSIYSGNKYCFGSNYKIEEGVYKLDGTINCDIDLTKDDNSTKYKNYYTFLTNYSSFSYWGSFRKFINKSYYNYNFLVFKNSPDMFYSNTSSTDSNIKKMLDNWYNKNFNSSKNSYYVSSSTGFCNDTSATISNNYYSYVSDNYNSRTRLTNSNKSPSFECDSSFEYGGFYNRNSVGLITADELAFAGASYGKINNNYYLAYNKPFWTMTPYSNNSMFTSTIYSVDGTENANGFSSEMVNSNSAQYTYLYVGDSSIAVRPVINIYGSDFTYEKNNGTKGNPYEIITDSDLINAYSAR